MTQASKLSLNKAFLKMRVVLLWDPLVFVQVPARHVCTEHTSSGMYVPSDMEMNVADSGITTILES